MRWFRSNIRFGSRLALFALAVQMVLSFGHVHLQAFARIAAAPQAVTDVGSGAQDLSPIHRQHGLADFDCPICALIQLASSSAPSAAPHLPPPVARDAADLQIFAALPPAASPQLLFRARAPPSV